MKWGGKKTSFQLHFSFSFKLSLSTKITKLKTIWTIKKKNNRNNKNNKNTKFLTKILENIRKYFCFHKFVLFVLM